MVNKLSLAMFVAAVAIALIAGSFVEITDSISTQNGITVERKHSLFFETSISTYPAFLEITKFTGNANDTIGFDISPNELDFGKIPAGGSTSRKYVYISNPTGQRARVIISKGGQLENMMNTSESFFLLLPGEGRNVSITVGSGAYEPGNYTGGVSIIFRKASTGFLEFLV